MRDEVDLLVWLCVDYFWNGEDAVTPGEFGAVSKLV
jgi:hypothetical protein